MSIETLGTLVPIICAFWVFIDACNNHIGVYRDEQQKIHGRSPIWWGVVTLLLVFIFLPYYLIERKSMLEKAKTNPVSSDKSIGILILLVLSGILFWYFHLRY